MTYDKVFDYWVSRAPRESKSGGSGVGDTIPRRGSTDEVHATQVSKAQDPKQCNKEKDTHQANDVLDYTYEKASCRVEAFRLEDLLQDVLVRFLQNAYIWIGACFIEPLPDECPFRMLL